MQLFRHLPVNVAGSLNQVSISYGDMQSFRRAGDLCGQRLCGCFNLLRRYAVIPTLKEMWVSPPYLCFNLLRRYAVIPTGGQMPSMGVLLGFNLLRRYAVIPTRMSAKAMRRYSSSFNLLRRYAVIPTPATPPPPMTIVRFQSPTEICSHSDQRRPPHAGCSWWVSISYGDMQSFRPCYSWRDGANPRVSISYGDMQSFRPAVVYAHSSVPI